MAETEITFDDGGTYEQGMGGWSRLVGETFLDWLDAEQGLDWLDVGCGTGAFTALLAQRCAPANLQGIDPSAAQLEVARARLPGPGVGFTEGDSMELPFPAARFDAAVMALVIFFVPDPARGLAEMVRVTRPGGLVASYSWDFENNGLPFAPVFTELQAVGIQPARPPSVTASYRAALLHLWQQAGLVDIRTQPISVRRSFGDFDDFWAATVYLPVLRAQFAALPQAGQDAIKDRVRQSLPRDAEGRISYFSHANAIVGRVPEA